MTSVTAIVLAGGRGSRLGGTKKALLDVGGRPLIERVLEAVRPVSDEIVVVDNDDELAHMAGTRIVPDREPRGGGLVGLASGLAQAKGDLCLVVACDMPFLNTELLGWLVDQADDSDVVVPVHEAQMDPLHAVYRRSTCLPVVESALGRGEKRITAYLRELRRREVVEAELRVLDPDLRSLFNINTPEDLALARSLAG